LIGVRQTGKRGHPPYAETVTGIGKPEPLRQAIEGLVNTHLDVRPGPLVCHAIPHEEGSAVLVVEVPANTYCLSMVTYNDIGQFWIRRGTDNRLMTTDEIEYKFSEFAKVRDSASLELRKIRMELRRSQIRPMVWFAGVPIARARDHIPVDIGAMQEIVQDSSYFHVFPSKKRHSSCVPPCYVRSLVPGLRGIILSRELGERAVLEIRRDGTVIFAHKAAHGTKGGPPREMIAIGSIYEPLMSGIFLLADVQNKFGIAKLALVQAGLMGVKGKAVVYEDGHFAAPEFDKVDCPLDPILLDELWVPRDLFDGWARQIANALHQVKPLIWPPLVPRG